MSKFYIVTIKEIWARDISVEVHDDDSIEDILHKANDIASSNQAVSLDYSHALSMDSWDVYNEEGELVF